MITIWMGMLLVAAAGVAWRLGRLADLFPMRLSARALAAAGAALILL